MINKITMIFKRIKHVAEWAVFLWNDYDWDFIFILQVLKFKLVRTRKNLESDPWHSFSKKSRRKMLVCETILDRLVEEEYRWIAINAEPLLKDVPWHQLNVKLTDQQSKAFKRATEQEDRLRNNDLDLLFKIFKSQYRTWWT